MTHLNAGCIAHANHLPPPTPAPHPRPDFPHTPHAHNTVTTPPPLDHPGRWRFGRRAEQLPGGLVRAGVRAVGRGARGCPGDAAAAAVCRAAAPGFADGRCGRTVFGFCACRMAWEGEGRDGAALGSWQLAYGSLVVCTPSPLLYTHGRPPAATQAGALAPAGVARGKAAARLGVWQGVNCPAHMCVRPSSRAMCIASGGPTALQPEYCP